MKQFYLTFGLLILSCFSIVNAQTCSSYTYNPTIPATCDYTYTATGWKDASGNPTTAPASFPAGTTVCILANNNDNMPNSGVKGTLYIGPGVTYTGQLKSILGATIIVDGHADLSSFNPSINNSTIYIGSAGQITVPGTLNPAGSSIIHNNGTFNIGGDLSMGGSVLFVSYPGSKTTVQGDASIASDYENCGIFKVLTDLNSGGSSGLANYCSVYVQGDMTLNADFTNDALFVLEGILDFGTATFYNNDKMILNNIDLNNDDLIGDDDNSLLIVRNNAALTSGGTITGHLFYDENDGGGFDTVCASCVEDIDEIVSMNIPATTDEILEDCGANVYINNVLVKSKLDFDGVDDYIHTPEFIDGKTKVTIMGWIKSDTGNSTDMTIAGEDTGCKIWLDDGTKPSLTVRTIGNAETTISAPAINLNEWHHISGAYNSTDGTMKLYVDGKLSATTTLGTLGSAIQCTASKNGNFEIGRTSKVTANRQHFKGDIDEVRVFQVALTDSQIQRMVYQEIENNGGVVKGKVIGKNITDVNTGATINWTDLIAYYTMMDIISYDRTTDFSVVGRRTRLKNITTEQEQTAPMPYISSTDGAWSSAATWLYGNVWDIDNIALDNDYKIVKISSNVTMSHSINHIGLIIDSGKKLSTSGDIGVTNSWYLELNGTLDLASDSQLIQTSTSDLVTSATGKILRRQEGQANIYRYNYWGSPVGATAATTLTDNNTTANNTNNTSFNLGMLKDKNGNAMTFTNDYDGSNSISTYWLYTFINGVTYWDWNWINSSTNISPGVGYTQKGTGTTDPTMQYIFEGKPNNGTILLSVTDTGGPGSVPSVSETDYVVGNPYPSALDLHKFIDDNAGVISGDIRIWEHWGGNSHILNEYEGGYAVINKLGTIRAYQFTGYYGANTGAQNGTLTPTRYMPVGQGFVVEITGNGTLQFNNSQRKFIKEVDANGTYSSGSVFLKGSDKPKTKTPEPEVVNNTMKKFRLKFVATGTQKTARELLLGFSNMTSDGYDFGYDSQHIDVTNTDLNLDLNGTPYNMAAYSTLTSDKVIPLMFKTSVNNSFEISITDLEEIDPTQEIYIKDNFTNTIYDLRANLAYYFTSNAGTYNDRFQLVFQKNESPNYEAILKTIFFENKTSKLFAKIDEPVSKIVFTTLSGKVVFEASSLKDKKLEKGYPVNKLPKDTYVVIIKTVSNKIYTKKIWVE